RQYQSFIFDRYRYDSQNQALELCYSLDDEVYFREIVSLPSEAPVLSPDDPSLDAALFTLFLIGGISYYKSCCPREIVVRPRALTEGQAAFWDRVYENGLGEFFYRNQIDFRGLVRFPSGAEPAPPPDPGAREAPRRFLVPMGGGKDSIVT